RYERLRLTVEVHCLHQRLRHDHRDTPALNSLPRRQRQVFHQARDHGRLVDEALPERGQRPSERVVEAEPGRHELETLRKVAANDRAVTQARNTAEHARILAASRTGARPRAARAARAATCGAGSARWARASRPGGSFRAVSFWASTSVAGVSKLRAKCPNRS